MVKVCVVTGGSSGIGKDIAERFYKSGYEVVVIDILECKNPNLCYIKADLSELNQIEAAFVSISQKYTKAHVLINNGAIASFQKHIKEVEEREFDKLIDVNLKGAYFCAKEFVRLNQGEAYGRIINISSTRWHQNEADWELYGMSKGGIVSLTNSLCVSLLGTPITVNAISPGYIYTGNYGEIEKEEHEIHPSNRVGKPRDISNTCLFLADEQNDFINGANIVVDGGMTKKMIY